jgi:hypothetical protein
MCQGKRDLLNLSQVLAAVDGITVSQEIDTNMEVKAAFGADLMSDALRFGRRDMLLVTGLTNLQTIRTAEMLDVRAVLFVRAKLPPQETVALAQEAGIALLATRYTMYEASGLLYSAGLAGLGPCGDFGQA